MATMNLDGPIRYRLEFDATAYHVECPKGSRTFAGLASQRAPKLYVVARARPSDGRIWPIYVGVTRQPLGARFRLGWFADGRTGYHGYAWRRAFTDAVVDVWSYTPPMGMSAAAAKTEIETVEAELVYLIRQGGQWPEHQTEIHFHPSAAHHRLAAAQAFTEYVSPTARPLGRVAPSIPVASPRPGRGARGKGTTTPGFKNRNRQQVVRLLGLPGTDHGQTLYELRCLPCGQSYAANASDIHLRKCPACQNGRHSTSAWKP